MDDEVDRYALAKFFPAPAKPKPPEPIIPALIAGTKIRRARADWDCTKCRGIIAYGTQYVERTGASPYSSGPRYCIACAAKHLAA